MAAGSPMGHVGFRDLEEKKLACQRSDAHSTAITGLTILHGEPLLITSLAELMSRRTMTAVVIAA